VIGAVVLFGFLIVALSLYQIQVVPQQSGQAEFEHFEDVQNDLVELRTAISAAGQSERPQFVDVKLGTSYQTRVFAINPPDPAGTLRTSDAYNITIRDDSGTTVNVSTRFIEYRPRYNEIESGSTWYDNSVLYVDEADSNRPAVIVEEQNILVDNDTLRLTAVQNEFSASGTRKVAVELYPTTDATDLSNLSGGLDVRIPTRLGSDDGYWNESIQNGSVTYQGMDDTAYPNSSGVSALVLRVDSPDNISVNSVGIQSEPSSEDAVKANVGPENGGGNAGGGNDGGNGGGGGSGKDVKDVAAESAAAGGSGKLEFTLNNTGSTDAIATAIVVNNSTNGIVVRDGDPVFGVKGGGGLDLVTEKIEIGSNKYDFDNDLTIRANSEVSLEFDAFKDPDVSQGSAKVNMNNETVFVTIYFDDGSQATYEITT
jgi:hypothetical protein